MQSWYCYRYYFFQIRAYFSEGKEKNQVTSIISKDFLDKSVKQSHWEEKARKINVMDMSEEL